MKIALFLPNWVGDLVMATPSLRALRRYYGPHNRLVGIMRPNLAELLQGTGWLDEQWFFDPRSSHGEWRRLALVARMRREGFDTAVLLTNSLHTAVLAWLGGARRRVGYALGGRGLLLTHKVHTARGVWRPRPMVDAYLALCEVLGCPAESPQLELRVTESEHQLGERIWHDLGLRRDGRVVALNSTGAYGGAKVWPIEYCGVLAQRIVHKLDCDVLVLCGPKEREMARDILGYASSPRVFTLADHVPSISATKSCLARCRALISTDSGPRHIAAALGIPVLTLLGPTLPIWIDNPTIRDPMLRLELDCIGCGKRVCPRGHHRCMRDLTPDRVFEEAARLLGDAGVQAA